MVEIVPLTEETKKHIQLLNYEWLQKYFKVEPIDVLQLSHPHTEIISKGGFIFYAKYHNEIVGTYSLLKISDTEYELAKMAVTGSFQGMGIGRQMMEHCMQRATELRAKTISLFSNTKLQSAILLYRQFGFVEVPLPTDIHYERADIKMERSISV